MKILKGKSKRTVIFTVITIVSIAVLLASNVLLSYFGGLNNFYIDLTERGIYTMTDKMADECAFVDELGETDGDKCVKITFCTDPDYLTESDLTRATYFMALNMQKEFDNVEVETVNVYANPGALSRYKTTSLTTFVASDIIISYGDRYRIISADAFWLSNYTLYNGEYVMASLIKSVTAIEQPVAYFVTGHGETVFDVNNPESAESLEAAALYDLLRAQGMRVELLDLSKVNGVPKDCAALIINDPTSDFEIDSDKLNSMSYMTDIEKIEKYLVNDQGALLVARDYERSFKNLDAFLKSWGFEFGSSVVTDKEEYIVGAQTDLITVYNKNEGSVANAIYKEFASILTAPKAIVTNTGYITTSFARDGYQTEAGAGHVSRQYSSFLTSSDGASAYFKDNAGAITNSVDNIGMMDLAGLTARQSLNEDTAETTYSFVFCAASADFFSNALLSNASYANYDVVSALVNTVSRTDIYASTDLGGSSYNSSSVGGKQIFEDTMESEDWQVMDINNMKAIGTKQGLSESAKIIYTVLFMVAPLVALGLGVFVCIRRKFL